MMRANDRLTDRIVTSIVDGVIVIDEGGDVALMNPAAEEILNRSSRVVMGRPLETLFPQQDMLDRIRRCRMDGMALRDQELTVTGRGGKVVHLSVTISPLLDGEGGRSGIIIVLRDVSTTRELERSTRHEERLAMLGTMVVGLAHEIRNPLGGIRGAAQLMRREMGSGSGFDDYLRVIVRETERVDRLVSRLLDLGRSRDDDMGQVEINRLIADVLMLNGPRCTERGIAVVQTLDTSIPLITGSEGGLTQLIHNLVRNAIDALPEGGTIMVTTGISGEYLVSRGGGRRSRMVSIEIADTGPGFPDEVIERLGTPFFTTKPDGTGLGLSLSQKIVSDHRGMIRFGNRRGGGGVVTVSLPLDAEPERNDHGN